MTARPSPGREPAPKINTTVPNSARVWNYWLGGRDHYEIDRVAGYHYSVVFPEIVEMARADRVFLARVVRYLAGDSGVRQFIDIGTGLPTADNTHEVAQRSAPEARIVYVDNDPLVLAYARALLTSSAEGATDYVSADLRDPHTILREAEKTLDFSQPVALILMGVLGHVRDYDETRSIVTELVRALVPGSYLAINDSVASTDRHERALRQYAETGAAPYYTRSRNEMVGFFDGLDLVDPGVVPVHRWRPGPGTDEIPEDLPLLGGVARKGLGFGRPLPSGLCATVGPVACGGLDRTLRKLFGNWLLRISWSTVWLRQSSGDVSRDRRIAIRRAGPRRPGNRTQGSCGIGCRATGMRPGLARQPPGILSWSRLSRASPWPICGGPDRAPPNPRHGTKP